MLYDIEKSYLENAEKGPFFSGTIPERKWPPENEWIDFLGFRLASPIGVAAGPLLNANWIDLAGQLHYDLVCYKTIRTKAHSGHALPNILYIEGENQFSHESGTVTQRLEPPTCLEHLAITNYFGMPSRSNEYLRSDIPEANRRLKNGQLMIVSVVGTPGNSHADFLDDFVATAVLAKECGAKLIEANYSCPNVGANGESLYLDSESVFRVTQAISRAIRPIPLIIKVGCYPHRALLQAALRAAEKGGAQAIAGINTLSKRVVSPSGEPALGPGRFTSGICGAPIREAALDFVRGCRSCLDEDKMDLKLIGGGGIVLPEHFDLFFAAGADISMTASGMMWNPYLAIEYRKLKNGE